MMEFRTCVEIDSPKVKIGYRDKVMFLGSCFADEIGSKMSELRFSVSVNPFGVLFNPSSIVASIEKMIDNSSFDAEIVVKNKDVYFSRMHSGLFASLDENILLSNVNESLIKAREFFSKSEFVVVSLGTAWVYRYIKGDFVVANCHKSPASEFKREFLNPQEIYDQFAKVISAHPEKNWIFTVSPVRHFKDGAHGNQLSKSSLHLAIELLKNSFHNVSYFPAYEILNDELRDYRFYATDMLHPSEMAVDYIWQRFAENYTKSGESQLISKIERVNSMNKHRALFSDSSEYKSFAAQRDKLEKEIQAEIAKLRL